MSRISYSVQEGSTGVLYLTNDDGNVEIYQPNCDLEKAREYLYEFHELTTNFNKQIKDSFFINGADWYSATISKTYWQFFFQYVKYESLIERWRKGEIKFNKIGPGRFNNLMKLFLCNEKTVTSKIRNYIRRMIASLVMHRNNIIVKKNNESKKNILFLRENLFDFRTNLIINEMQSQFSVVQLIPFPKKKPFTMFDSSYCIWPIGHSNYNLPDNLLNAHVNEHSFWIYKFALKFTKQLIVEHLTKYNLLKINMSGNQFDAMVGIDDCNWSYPFIHAAKDIKIKCIGIQHGHYAKRHEAYVMRNINNHLWYDYLLVWGDYWRELFLRYNKIFKPENVIVASKLERAIFSTTKHNDHYKIIPKKPFSKTILIPYEFLADTILIGKFIKEFCIHGFSVYFKPRMDENIEDQIKSYNLGVVADKLTILYEINHEIMANIDIVAGTMTTLLYDLLPYNKPTWILETPYRFHDDMVENGLAHLFTWKDLEKIDNIYNEDMNKTINIDGSFFVGDAKISETISNLITE